ncbi:MAG TPA: T9SS type A sorting domain-containing protein [Cytophagaceae bacterium]
MTKILHSILTIFLLAIIIQAEVFAVSDTIYIKDNKFNVNNTGNTTLTIQEGKDVVFKWVNGSHNIVSTNPRAAWVTFNINSNSTTKILSGLAAGTYTFKCGIHSNMTGTITVVPGNANQRPTNSQGKYELTIVPDYYDNQIVFNLNSGGQSLRGIKVFDIIGKEVAFIDLMDKTGVASYTVNFSHLKPGIYLCSIYSDKGILETRRIIWN